MKSLTVRRGDIPPRAPIPCRLYWIYGPDPRSADPTWVLLYVGETVDTPTRGPRVRFAEHVQDQPWGDTLPVTDPTRAIRAGVLRVSHTVYPHKEAVWAAERAAIRAGRPLYNYTHNETNPDRITIHAARAARAARDQANRVPRWRRWKPPTPTRRRVRMFIRRRWRRPTAWAVASLTLMAVLAPLAPILSLPRLAIESMGLATLGMLYLTRPRRPGWEQAGNLLLRVTVGVLMAVTAWAPVWGWLTTGR